MTYLSGTTAAVGDIIAVQQPGGGGQKSRYLVVSLSPVVHAGAGGTGGHDERFLAVIPYDPLAAVNVEAGARAVLWSEFEANGHIFG